ncbi:MAG: PQQ-binding-like beta-propeller repeat protein [Planctomycetales bacterium]|nr:PQQ-binding-like beta-propeller repeat protein [Planctomycetales bacterium]
MLSRHRSCRAMIAASFVLAALAGACRAAPESPEFNRQLTVVVMDPLAAPLSCPCVEGYAQRRYEVLGEYLSRRLKQPVAVVFSETIAGALAKEQVDAVDLVIGKDSVVRAEGKRLKLKPALLARLTGKDGKTTQHGLVVVRSADAAREIADLAGYRILFGPADCDEKFAAARKLLAAAGVKTLPADKCETSEACSDGATKIIEWGDSQHAAAVISSYAAPLLEGCGTIKKGDLRVVGETDPVPFVAAFATNRLSAEQQAAVRDMLIDAAGEPEMLAALESLLGFLPAKDEPALKKQTHDAATTDANPGEQTKPAASPAATTDETAPAEQAAWSGWLGPHRNGRCAWLPRTLPATPTVAWRHPLSRPGLGGIAATPQYVVIGDRDAANVSDVFRCLSADTGDELWTVAYPAPGRLDYDNLPRATPLILDDRVYLFGAFGDLTCASLADGAVVWRTNVRRQFFATDDLPWGTCSSPLAVDGLIVVNPGAPDAALAALDAATGETVWQTPGEPQGYGSLTVATLGGVRQIVGHTQSQLGGWDPATGEQLWSLAPPYEGDFNVPTPVAVDGRLLVCTENNATRLFDFDDQGRIIPDPLAESDELAPDISTPVAVGSRVFCVNHRLLCLDAERELALVGDIEDDAFADYGAILAAEDRLLVQGRGNELLLIEFSDAGLRIAARAGVVQADAERSAVPYTYPAIVGDRLYVRTPSELLCLPLQ